jgi:DNA-binding response OmpR family regulator
MEAGKILIVDDETNIRRGLKAVLIKDGHDVKDVASAEEALHLLLSFSCEVAIVDIRMSGMSGVELLHEIKERWPIISVILLTGHGTLETAMTAVKEGAFDYLLKPSQPDEIRQTVFSAIAASRRQREEMQLFNSLRSSLQRMEELPASPSPTPDPQSNEQVEQRHIRVGDLQIDLPAHEVRLGGEIISLSPSEFQLLVVLAKRPGEVIDYVTLVKLALDYEAESWEAKELIKRHIFSLRQKMEPEPASPRYILNVRGIGYRLASPENLS